MMGGYPEACYLWCEANERDEGSPQIIEPGDEEHTFCRARHDLLECSFVYTSDESSLKGRIIEGEDERH